MADGIAIVVSIHANAPNCQTVLAPVWCQASVLRFWIKEVGEPVGEAEQGDGDDKGPTDGDDHANRVAKAAVDALKQDRH